MKRILLVEDDPATCRAATGILQELECAVHSVPSSGAALEHLRRAVPDVVLVGVNIPEMADGWFVDACHHEAQCADLPVVVMAVTPRAAIDAIRMGARGCIKMPLDIGGVVAALQPLLAEEG